MNALRLRWRGQMDVNEGASPATLKVKSQFGQTGSRGSVQDCLWLCRWGEPGQGRMGVLQNNPCWWFGQSPSSLPSSSHPLKADYCSPELFTLLGSAVGVCFWWGTPCRQNSSCLAFPCVRSLSWWDRTEDELQQLESQMRSRMLGGTQSVEL